MLNEDKDLQYITVTFPNINGTAFYVECRGNLSDTEPYTLTHDIKKQSFIDKLLSIFRRK